MDKELRPKLAEIWKECLEAKLDIFDDKSQKKLLIRHWFDEIPQPGFVGCNYKHHGLLFIGMNPGPANKSRSLDSGNLILYKRLAALRMASKEDLEKEFDELNKYLSGFMTGMGIYRDIEQFLERLNILLSDVAYLNLLKWRTKENVSLKALYEISWDKHTTHKQIEALEPGVVIALGKGAGDWIEENKKSDMVFQKAKIYVVSRDRSIKQDKREKRIKWICNKIKNESKQ